jgi:hypothetical protein
MLEAAVRTMPNRIRSDGRCICIGLILGVVSGALEASPVIAPSPHRRLRRARVDVLETAHTAGPALLDRATLLIVQANSRYS